MRNDENAAFRVGVIGLGLMGRRMLGALKQHGDFEVSTGFDLDPQVTAAMAAEFDFEPCESEAELIEGPIDLCYVATPPGSHVPLSRRVLEAGRALFLEKPLAVNLGEAQELVDLAEGSASPAVMNFPFATLPGLERIEGELGQGVAGQPLRVDIELHFSQWPRSWHHAGPWLAGDREGGFCREVFSHFAYLTQRLLGPLRLQEARTTRQGGLGETRVLADFMAGSTPLSMIGGVGGAAPDLNRWTLYCEKRSYRLEDWSIVSTSDGQSWVKQEALAGESRGADTQLNELAALLRGEPSCLPRLSEGLDVMRAVESLLE